MSTYPVVFAALPSGNELASLLDQNFNSVLVQIQQSTNVWAVATGTADAILAAYNPPNQALVDGMLLGFRALAANATTTPTFSPDGLIAHVITKIGGTALAASDIPGALAECLVRYNLAHMRWELLNPAVASGGAGANYSDRETPTGTIGGGNTAFVLAHSPNPAASCEGRLRSGGTGTFLPVVYGIDFTLSGANVTMTVAPAASSNLYFSYRY